MINPPSLFKPPSAYLPPTDTGLELLFQDSALIVANKPAGLLSVPGRGEGKQDCLTSRVQARFPEALVVHRLDMETSGLIVFALNPSVHRSLSYAFQTRQIEKQYLAVVDGLVANDEGEIALPLICDWPRRPLQKVDHELGKPSLTRYRVLSRDERGAKTRVELEPLTGRSHQLRVHMQSVGHAILGDALYAEGLAKSAASRLLLHASKLRFAHPVSGEALAIQSAAPF